MAANGLRNRGKECRGRQRTMPLQQVRGSRQEHTGPGAKQPVAKRWPVGGAKVTVETPMVKAVPAGMRGAPPTHQATEPKRQVAER